MTASQTASQTPTPRQYEVYKALKKLLRKPYKPSLDQIAYEVGLSKQTTYSHLCALRNIGMVSWDSEAKRSYVITEAKQ